jgi:endonuclease G, mitochondrial
MGCYGLLAWAGTAFCISCTSVSGHSYLALPAELLPSSSGCDQLVQHTAYILCYSEQDEQARWVAYRLTKQMCDSNTVLRKDKFIPDPMVTTGSAVTADYKNSGYDRGHLCPAGDMNWSRQTMEESFYMSNMSPQLHEFNAGIWEKLEHRVRKWAVRRGEVFVVAGGVLTKDLSKIGMKNSISVPGYFYKIIYSAKNGGSAIAFIIPHNACTGKSYTDFAVTVDSVEKVTGIDFFPQLPDSTETRMESSLSKSDWINN